MNRLRRYAVLLLVIEKLRECGSWCGETHIQKTVYFLEKLFSNILDYQFILYKYGPFSFDLRDDLGIMESIDAIRVVPQPPYGSQIVLGDLAKKIKELFPQTLSRTREPVEFVASKLSPKNVAELEILATSLYVEDKLHHVSELEKAREICRLKPHVSFKDALEGIREVRQIMEEARRLNYGP